MNDLGSMQKLWRSIGQCTYPDFKENLFSANSFNNCLFSFLTVQQQWKPVPAVVYTLECLYNRTVFKNSNCICENNGYKCTLYVHFRVTNSRDLIIQELVLDN